MGPGTHLLIKQRTLPTLPGRFQLAPYVGQVVIVTHDRRAMGPEDRWETFHYVGKLRAIAWRKDAGQQVLELDIESAIAIIVRSRDEFSIEIAPQFNVQ